METTKNRIWMDPKALRLAIAEVGGMDAFADRAGRSRPWAQWIARQSALGRGFTLRVASDVAKALDCTVEKLAAADSRAAA